MSKRFILIGHPVGHSVSPAIHHAAYQALGIDAHYDAVDCPDAAAVRHQVELIRSGKIAGANVTVPHKSLAFTLVDQIHPTAQSVGVANVLYLDDSQGLVACNTDASGLAGEILRCQEELRARGPLAGQAVEQRPAALIVGNGGAARGAVVACQLAGIPQVYVTARSFVAATPVTSWPKNEEFLSLGANLVEWPTGPGGAEALAQALEGCHLLIQATSAGMKGADDGEALAAAIPWSSFETGIAYDLVYNPPLTPFLRTAHEAGHVVSEGLGMLVGQAADAIEIWLHQKPPRHELLVAARRALSL